MFYGVAPLAGAWIEIVVRRCCGSRRIVAPLAGAWIEIYIDGLYGFALNFVAPLAGAWIEIANFPVFPSKITVAPLAGAWIEILIPSRSCLMDGSSLPLRERGLKLP